MATESPSSSLESVDANLLVVLDALLAERNLTRAGEMLGITQPAVSSSLNRLRGLLGDDLLVRVGRTFELTPRAEQMRPVVREAMRRVEITLNLNPVYDPRSSRRRFFIAASDYFLITMTEHITAVMAETAPYSSVEFQPLPDPTVGVDPVDLLRFDMIISGYDREMPGKRRALFADDLVWVVSAHNERLCDGALSLDDLAELRHIRTPHPGGSPADPFDQLCAAGVTPKVAIEVHGSGSVPELISGTQLVGYMPLKYAELQLARYDLVIAQTPISGTTITEEVHWHPSKSDDPALQWLIGALLKATERMEFGDEVA
jgi:LysR family nod box-dependent transcriptional activator